MAVYGHCDGEGGKIEGRAQSKCSFVVSADTYRMDIGVRVPPEHPDEHNWISLFCSRKQATELVEQLTEALEATAEVPGEEQLTPITTRANYQPIEKFLGEDRAEAGEIRGGKL